MKKIIIVAGVVVLAGIIGAIAYFTTVKNGNSGAVYADALAACGSYPNGSVQDVIETDRIAIKLPKGLYPNQSGYLPFTTASGTAKASWVSNAGPVGAAYGATSDCWAWYYEFDGRGEVDLKATSSVAGVPEYDVRFMVAPVYGNSTIEYRNDEYGFIFTLPSDWQGFTIATSTWHGTGDEACPANGCPPVTGPTILIRNPQWTRANSWQDIPIEIFTHSEWSAVTSGTLITSAAPIPPSELGSNAGYVFALPPRYDYAFPNGWQEVEAIIASGPLTTFAPGTVPTTSSISGIPPPAGAGTVQGSVLLGPICHVEQNPPQPQCAPRPYQTVIKVLLAGSSASIETIS